MLTQEIIRKKRDGLALTQPEIYHMVNGMMDGTVAPAQVSAFAMAVYFKGMELSECRALTESLLRSGTQLDWREYNLTGPVVDKHSTGGLGDKVSLIIAPLLAAAGCFVPMISGRSLGHTGGTLDKMDAIPGYNSQPELPLFTEVVREVGCAIVGQTSDLAPADKMLYAIRDVTATVESLPLITASILSKKVAAGLESLVLDVKVGSGSFNSTLNEAEALGKSLVEVGNAYGVKTSACITGMNQVLGTSMGNALEVTEAIEFLNGTSRCSRLLEVTLSLATELLLNTKLSDNEHDARQVLMNLLESGAAADKFAAMVVQLGGPEFILTDYHDLLPQAECRMPYLPEIEATSFLRSMDGRALGNLLITMGGGRQKTEDEIDFSVGFSDFTAIGEEVQPDQPILTIHAASQAEADRVSDELDKIFTYSDTKLPPDGPIKAIIRT